MKFNKKLLLMTSAILVGSAIAVAIYFLPNRHTYKIPSDVRSKISFPVLFLQEPTPDLSLDKSSIKYSQTTDSTYTFSFAIFDKGNRVVITEQAYPDVLIYDKLVNGIKLYSETGSIYGKISLGRPGGESSQLGVMQYAQSTLIFAQPENKPLTDSDWTKLFNSLDPIK